MITQVPWSVRTLGSSVAVSVIAARSVKVPSAPSNRCVTWTVTESEASTSSRITLEFKNVPDSGIAPLDEKVPGEGPNGLWVSIVTAAAFGMACGRTPRGGGRLADRLDRLDEQVEAVRDRGRLQPDDLPASVAPLVQRRGPRLVGDMRAAGDDVERGLVAQRGGIAGQPHRDRRAGLTDEEVDDAGVDATQELVARERGAGRVDQLEVGRGQLACGRGVRVDQRVQAGRLDRAQVVGLRRAR